MLIEVQVTTCGIQGEAAHALFAGIAQSTSLCVVDVSGNPLTPIDCYVAGELAGTCRTLDSLTVEGTQLLPVQDILNEVVVDLQARGFNSRSLGAVAGLLKHNTEISELLLQHNPLSERSPNNPAPSPTTTRTPSSTNTRAPPRHSNILGICPSSEQTGFAALGHYLAMDPDPCVTMIDLRGTGIDPRGAASLARGVRMNRRLEVVHLDGATVNVPEVCVGMVCGGGGAWRRLGNCWVV